MAEFVCKLGTNAGRVLTQTEEARSEEELRQRLRAQGFLIFSIHPKDFLNFQVRASRPGKIRPDDFLIFNQQFLTLSKSGLPLQKSLDLLAHQTRSDTLRVAIQAVRDKVRSGALLSEAFESTGSFPKIYCATVRAGERSGSLDRGFGTIPELPEADARIPQEIHFSVDIPHLPVGFPGGSDCFRD